MNRRGLFGGLACAALTFLGLGKREPSEGKLLLASGRERLGGKRYEPSNLFAYDPRLADFERGFREGFPSWNDVVPAGIMLWDLKGFETTSAGFPLERPYQEAYPRHGDFAVPIVDRERTDVVVRVREWPLEITVADDGSATRAAWLGTDGRVCTADSPTTRDPYDLGVWAARQLRNRVEARLGSLVRPGVAVIGEPECWLERDAACRETYLGLSAIWWAEDLEAA